MSKCISCNQEFQKIGDAQEFEIYQCKNCGFGKTKGSEINYGNYHRDEVYIKEDSQFENIFQKRVGIILKFKKNGLVLDIGSSTGTMLSLFAQKGWEVQGIEPSKNSSQQALKKGIPTLNTFFEKAKLENNKYDVVIANHVLEHIDDPVGFLEKIYKILKKGGIVLIDAPNFGSFSARTFGTKWQYLLPREHLWHFSSKSLANLLRKSGFSIVYKETHSGVWGYGNPFKELLQSLFGFKKRFFINFISSIPAWYVSKLGLGTGLTIVAKK